MVTWRATRCPVFQLLRASRRGHLATGGWRVDTPQGDTRQRPFCCVSLSVSKSMQESPLLLISMPDRLGSPPNARCRLLLSRARLCPPLPPVSLEYADHSQIQCDAYRLTSLCGCVTAKWKGNSRAEQNWWRMSRALVSCELVRLRLREGRGGVPACWGRWSHTLCLEDRIDRFSSD